MQPFGFASPLQFRGQEMAQRARAAMPTLPPDLPDPAQLAGAPKPKLPQLPPATGPGAGPSAMSRIPDMAPIQAPGGPTGAGIEDPSAAVSAASSNVADGMGASNGAEPAAPEGLDIGALLAHVIFGA